ncbi:hypothetical protein PC41400_21590 [Paenibacillus chitinolyticus]|uniref:DUF3168 domain-containing protein n=1 Tax=Paenibacillus chitinolyticus TaxID=79263 RepID=A0A410X085_9BACL|nr:hypothetical protein [Paenibacillus chitinolyticus]MCY9593723.1 hypothetical protein [Paenibacillus chitinolyticus]MCY9599711.1 hypothetical protein [Paenibacillus chitinolyticus]QAV20115.1 hypothetical protein PC41400_21590 [Paenibacillus chitinolyticus]
MSVELTDAITGTLKSDDELKGLLGVMPNATPAQWLPKLTVGMEPEITISKDTVPHLCVFDKPGRFSMNPLVYEGKFCVDIYAKTAAQARQIGSRLFHLLHDRQIMKSGFRSFLCVLAYEIDFATGITGVKGYQVIYDVDYIRMN